MRLMKGERGGATVSYLGTISFPGMESGGLDLAASGQLSLWATTDT